MASNSPIVVKNLANADVTFTGLTVQGLTASYSDRSVEPVSARPSMVLKMKTTPAVRTTTVSLRIPRMKTETINGLAVTTVADFALARVEILVPPSWTAAQAANLRVTTANLVQHATISAAADDGEFVW